MSVGVPISRVDSSGISLSAPAPLLSSSSCWCRCLRSFSRQSSLFSPFSRPLLFHSSRLCRSPRYVEMPRRVLFYALADGEASEGLSFSSHSVSESSNPVTMSQRRLRKLVPTLQSPVACLNRYALLIWYWIIIQKQLISKNLPLNLPFESSKIIMKKTYMSTVTWKRNL